MSDHDVTSHCAREAVEVMATGHGLPYAALLVSSVVLGFQVFRG
jgi:hypothetical protein